MALDMWPLDYTILFVTSHKVAEQLSRSSKQFRYSSPKSPTMHQFDGLVGKGSMLMENVRIHQNLPMLTLAGRVLETV
jgi:hypothetical protein